MDTIFALSTAPGKSGVAIIRVSGPQALEAARVLCGDIPAFHRASLRVLRASDKETLDQALVLTFPAGHSFTGEDVSEFHLHGSPAIVAAVFGVLVGVEGLRPAHPGEFTRRALENGRLDLSQAEGLADLIESETEAQRRQAMRVVSGGLRERADEWRDKLVRAAALIAATIDFADEDVPVDVAPEVAELISDVADALRSEIAGAAVAERVRSGFEVAIVGPPNAGKSTLLNALAGRDAALTSEIAGTTRDIIEVRMDIEGLPVTVLDTAGLRDSADPLESLGVARTRSRAARSDLRVFLLPEGARADPAPEDDDIVLRAKADLSGHAPGGVSGLTGFGIAPLLRDIAARLGKRTALVGMATHFRHRQAMETAVRYLDAALPLVEKGGETADIAAEELHAAIRALDCLVGRVDVEAVLDEIFSRFCLGK